MAYLVEQKNSPFWFGMWTGADGKKKKRTTRVRVTPNARLDGFVETKAQARARAQRIADKFEAAERGQVNAAKLRATINELMPENMALPSVRELLQKHLSRDVKSRTRRNDENAISQFLDWLGADADECIDRLTAAQVQGFVDYCLQSRKLARQTVSRYQCSIGMAFKVAVRQRLIPFSPFEGVEMPKSVTVRNTRLPFEPWEIRFLLEHLPEDWQSMVMCSYFLGGLRLSDAALLRWDSLRLDDEKPSCTIVTRKNKAEITLPVVKTLLEYLQARRKKHRESVYVHPAFARLYLTEKESQASDAFAAFVRAYSLSAKLPGGDGRKNGFTRKTFHSIRYAVATLLAAAGVDSLMVMRIQTHKASNVHFGYVVPTTEQMRPALEKLEEILRQ